MNSKDKPVKHPLFWVPTLYLAEGLPWAVVMIMASIMYAKLGVSNSEITFWVGLLGLAWVIKPIFSPFLEVIKSKKAAVVVFQIFGGLALLATGSSLHMQGFFLFSVAMLSLVALASTTHDIAADGLYIENLSPTQQAMYSGWQGTFWNTGKLLVQGGLVYLAGELEARVGVAGAWSTAVSMAGGLLIALGLYHWWAAPPIERITTEDLTIRFVARTLADVLRTFFAKKGVWLSILFVILFRMAEGQVQTISRIFLLAPRDQGGLGLTTSQMGIAYGTFSTIAFMVGGILGGYFGAWRGLRKSMFILILAMNVPNIIFWYLSSFLPTDIYFITAALSVEMLGYGFGYTGVMLYLMQVVAPGKYVTAHYSVGTGIMALGLSLSTAFSGKIQAILGYHDFFIWTVVAALPVLILSLIVPLPDKIQENKNS